LKASSRSSSRARRRGSCSLDPEEQVFVEAVKISNESSKRELEQRERELEIRERELQMREQEAAERKRRLQNSWKVYKIHLIKTIDVVVQLRWRTSKVRSSLASVNICCENS
jgi:hypothetical protein